MRRQRFILAGALAPVAGGLIGPPPATAATIALTCPGDSLQAAIDRADPGDAVTIAAGNYTENVTIGKNLTVTGAGRAVTIIDGSGGTTSTITILSGVACGHSPPCVRAPALAAGRG